MRWSGENGAFYFVMTKGKLLKKFHDAEAVRVRNRERLAAIGERILEEVPGCALASDQPYRETDLAIDYCEDVPALPLEAAERIAGLMRAEGLTAKDQLDPRERLVRRPTTSWRWPSSLFAEQFDCSAAQLQKDFAFAGDSPNDAPMFAFFEHSVGVANVARFEGALEAEPKYVTRGAAGAGFAELAAHLLGTA